MAHRTLLVLDASEESNICEAHVVPSSCIEQGLQQIMLQLLQLDDVAAQNT